MPPLKTYIFETTFCSNIKIEIEAFNFVNAYEKLVMITKHPADFICVNK